MRKEALGWFALLPALILYYLWTLSLHALALLGLFLLFFIGDQIRLSRVRKKSRAQVQLAISGEKNAPLEGKLIVENPSLLPDFRGECLLEIHNMMTDQKTERVLPFSLAGREERDFSFQFRPAHYGGYRATVLKTSHCDFSGAFVREKKETFQAKTTVFPEIIAHWDDWHVGEISDKESDVYSEHKKGYDPGEIFGLREYTPGDSIKFIHWKLTAKTDKTMIRELGFPVDNTILLYYETRLPQEGHHPDFLDRYIRRFAGAAMHFVDQHQPFTIGYYSEEQERHCFDQIGTEQQLYNCLTNILDQKRGRGTGSTLEAYRPIEHSYGVIYYFSLGETEAPAHLAAMTKVIAPVPSEVGHE